MIDLEQLARPLSYEMPQVALDRLAGLREAFLDDTSYNSHLLAGRNYLEGIQNTAYAIREEQVHPQKPKLQVSKYITIDQSPNCTDTTATQLVVCGAIGQTAFAKFDGAHASTIVKESDADYYELGGPKHTRFSANFTDSPSVISTAQIIAGLEDHTGALQWTEQVDGERIEWKSAFFDSADIREKSKELVTPRAEGRVYSATIYVNPLLAFRMLRAIDVLETLRKNQLSPTASAGYILAKAKLSPLVPRLS